jgi:hypothetical protein
MTTAVKSKRTLTKKRHASSNGELLAGISSDAVKAKTGKTWAQWCKLLDKEGASEMPHRDIAILVSQEHGVGPWWSQMVTVGYEQARGLRKKHETSRGWQAGASKTINVSLADLFAAWDNVKLRRQWLGDQEFTIRKKNANKSMRITWQDGTDVEVNFYTKGPTKSQVAIQHGKLKSETAVARMKKLWRTAVAKLQEVCGSAAG